MLYGVQPGGSFTQEVTCRQRLLNCSSLEYNSVLVSSSSTIGFKAPSIRLAFAAHTGGARPLTLRLNFNEQTPTQFYTSKKVSVDRSSKFPGHREGRG